MPFGNAVGEGFNNSEVIIANKVIVEGPGEGVFVYNGTPGLGNLPIFWAGTSPDPYGNTLPSTSGVAGSGSFQAGNTIITATGVYTYSSTPGVGNLISSTGVQTAGTDPFGNHTLEGNASYQPGFANAMIGGAILYYTGTLSGGWTLRGQILIDSSGDFIIDFGNAVADGNLTVDGSFSNPGGQTGTGLPAGQPTGGPNSGTFAGHTHDFDGHTHAL